MKAAWVITVKKKSWPISGQFLDEETSVSSNTSRLEVDLNLYIECSRFAGWRTRVTKVTNVVGFSAWIIHSKWSWNICRIHRNPQKSFKMTWLAKNQQHVRFWPLSTLQEEKSGKSGTKWNRNAVELIQKQLSAIEKLFSAFSIIKRLRFLIIRRTLQLRSFQLYVECWLVHSWMVTVCSHSNTTNMIYLLLPRRTEKRV